MDESLRGKLLGECPGCPLYLSDSEQQVWLAAQKAMLEVGYRKPHPADGELVKCPLEDSCDAFQEQECDVCTVGQVRQAQLAHDKARMLPSEDELALWLCDHLNYTSRGLAQVLRERLEVKP